LFELFLHVQVLLSLNSHSDKALNLDAGQVDLLLDVKLLLSQMGHSWLHDSFVLDQLLPNPFFLEFQLLQQILLSKHLFISFSLTTKGASTTTSRNQRGSRGHRDFIVDLHMGIVLAGLLVSSVDSHWAPRIWLLAP
jgi:hypothetical protein